MATGKTPTHIVTLPTRVDDCHTTNRLVTEIAVDHTSVTGVCSELSHNRITATG